VVARGERQHLHHDIRHPRHIDDLVELPGHDRKAADHTP
jgi:hypothetical protein